MMASTYPLPGHLSGDPQQVRIGLPAMSSAPTINKPPQIQWPAKFPLFDVNVSATTYDEATRCIIDAARKGLPGIVSCHAAHAIVTASDDASLRDKVNTFEMITPDGQPVRWALNLLHGVKLTDRVYGPELTLRVCAAARDAQIPIFLYGGTPETIQKLKDNLRDKYPGLNVAGDYAPPFRSLTPDEDHEIVARIKSSHARIVFIGLGCPKQDLFAFDHRDSIGAIQLCVGAAFDMHAGIKQMAPEWMQRHGLEWLFRLMQEPRRLARRYLVTNTIFALKLARQLSPWGSSQE